MLVTWVNQDHPALSDHRVWRVTQAHLEYRENQEYEDHQEPGYDNSSVLR